MRVLDDEQQRLLRRDIGHKSQGGEADQKDVRDGVAGSQPERHLECVPLNFRKLIEPPEEWQQQVV